MIGPGESSTERTSDRFKDGGGGGCLQENRVVQTGTKSQQVAYG